jgi:hypothetical protein
MQLYSLTVGDRTIYLHADSFKHAEEILFDAVEVILTGGTENLGEMVAVTPDRIAQ